MSEESLTTLTVDQRCFFLFCATEFLRKASPQQIVDASPKTLTEEDARKNIGLAFVPSVESEIKTKSASFDPEHDQAFLTEDPTKLLKEGRFNKVPLMLGFNSHEAMLFLRRECRAKYSFKFLSFIHHLRPKKRQNVADKVRK